MSDLVAVRALAAAAAASLDASRQRIDDLNVYPVPDGDTGTNLSLTVRAIVAALEELDALDRRGIARAVTRAALMGARGNSGVILSQIVRGAAEVFGESAHVDADALSRALRSASDTAYRGVRTPVEGTMLTVIREMAEEAEARSPEGPAVPALVDAVLERGEDALRRTPEQLDVLREAGVVDAGGAGLVEIVRGVAAALSGRALPTASGAAAPGAELPLDAVHMELSRFRYCTSFVVEGAALDTAGLERELERLGDSLLVVGDGSALKVHVHTDDPGAALSVGTRSGSIAAVEIADMHEQTRERERRLESALAEAVGPADTSTPATDVVAVVAGDGNRRLYEVMGAAVVVEGGQSMNPSTQEIVAAVERTRAVAALVLPNNANVIMSAEQAATLATKPVVVVPTRSIQAGLAALEAFDASRTPRENAEAMAEAVEGVATGAVTTASRDVELDGRRVAKGEFLGLLEGDPLVGGDDFQEVASAVVEALLDEPHAMVTFLTGEDAPDVTAVVSAVEARHPEIEVEVRPGGQPHYHLLLAAE